MSIFSQTGFGHSNKDIMYRIDGYGLFRNDAIPLANNVRPFGVMTGYSRADYYPG